MKSIIDIHTHGIGSYDTRTSNPAHILKIAEIHGRYSVSEIIPTIYPAQIEKMRENMEAVKKAMEMQKSGFGVGLSRIIGIHLEGPFLNHLKSGALDSASFIKPSEYNLKKLIEGFEDIIRIITIAPELRGAVKLIKIISDMGIIASMGHSDARYTEAEAGFHAGAKGITHIFNAMREFHHREPGIAGFGLLNPHIFIEIIADPFHIHQKNIELIFKIKNHERIIIVSDSVKKRPRSINYGEEVQIKSITDTQGRLYGGSMAVTLSTKRLIGTGLKKEMVMKCVSKNPLSYLKQ